MGKNVKFEDFFMEKEAGLVIYWKTEMKKTKHHNSVLNFQLNSFHLYLSTALHSRTSFKAALQEKHVSMLQCHLAPIKGTLKSHLPRIWKFRSVFVHVG